jgi:hypothetical protein
MVLRVGPLDRLITDELHYTVAGSCPNIAEASRRPSGPAAEIICRTPSVVA